MLASVAATRSLEQKYWLAVRGAQQMDLASRFAERAEQNGLEVLALKGISIADEFYGSLENRPMADIDFLVVDTARFEEAADLARALKLIETGASDHALVFKEEESGVVLELHVSLTACPGLFPIDHADLWARRQAVAGSTLSRLGNTDLIVHFALHTAFQHGFTANEFHYGDFVRALETFMPASDQVRAHARRGGAQEAVAAMAYACRRRFPESSAVRDLAEASEHECPRALARWIDGWDVMPPPLSLTALGFVRYQLAPSKWGYVRRSLLPVSIPGRSLARPHPLRRILNVLDVARTKSKRS